MTNKQNTIYPPDDRDFGAPSVEDLKSYSPSGDFTMLPNPATDPIVANNISNVEFDYTEDSILDTSETSYKTQTSKHSKKSKK
nr:hypothetical protein [Clostridium cavendishii]